jgi:hypothetical protein
MYVVVLLGEGGEGGGGGNWCGHPRQHSTKNSKINISNLRKHILCAVKF